MQVADLLAALAAEITDTRGWVKELRSELAEAQQRLTDLQVESRAIENALSRYGAAQKPPPLAGVDPEWAALTRVDAIERALREAGPLHLNEIQSYLVQRGCPKSSVGAISATLTNLHQHRSSVANVGKGRWDYVAQPCPEKLAEDAPPGPAKLVVL